MREILSHVGYLIYGLASFSLRQDRLGFVNYFILVFIGSIILFYQNKNVFKHHSQEYLYLCSQLNPNVDLLISPFSTPSVHRALKRSHSKIYLSNCLTKQNICPNTDCIPEHNTSQCHLPCQMVAYTIKYNYLGVSYRPWSPSDIKSLKFSCIQ